MKQSIPIGSRSAPPLWLLNSSGLLGGCGLALLVGVLLIALSALLIPAVPRWTSAAVVLVMITVTGVARSPIQRLVMDRPPLGWALLVVFGVLAFAAFVALAATEGIAVALGAAAFIAISVYFVRSMIGKTNQAEYLRRTNINAATLYENTAKAIEVGRLSPLGIEPDSKTAPANLAERFPASEGSALWYLVQYVPPDEGEFLLTSAYDYVITSVRWLQREGSTGAMIEVPAAKLASYSVDMRTGTIYFTKMDGGSISCKLTAGQNFITGEFAEKLLQVVRRAPCH